MKNERLDYVKKGGRVLAHMCTGTKVHKPKKGKGSYKREKMIVDDRRA